MQQRSPNSPGSEEAVNNGCTCPVIDNHYGAGFPYGSEGMCYWINEDCPLHATKGDKINGVE